jgi:hypothetical protein
MVGKRDRGKTKTPSPPPPVQFQPPNCRDRLKRTWFAFAVRLLMHSICVFLGRVDSCLPMARE